MGLAASAHMLRRSRALPSELVKIEGRPLFQKIPPWWARWALPLVVCDIFMTASSAELAWNHWTKLEEPKQKRDAATSPPNERHFVPRPLWQRLGLCLGTVGIGTAAAGALLIAQARYVRTFNIVSGLRQGATRRKPTRSVVIQGAHNWRNNGEAFPIDSCLIREGRDASEIILSVKGRRGHWHLGLEDAIVDGNKRSLHDAQKIILDRWGAAPRHGLWTSETKRSGWRDGPAAISKARR
ncbi:hypothetical protein HGRIS_001954 [Hohenbuehelia grisea]|uniref:Uncharacterized protein n=1 Tax=Hohenbuehelia grisea TaxID=104357 RepID=A0ABR3JK13_9AGAR